MKGLLNRVKLLDNNNDYFTIALPVGDGKTYRVLEHRRFGQVIVPERIVDTHGLVDYCEEFNLHREDTEQITIFDC